MTDQRLRDLERDAAHGDLQAEARLLLERVRVGDLTEDRLLLAAYLGDEAARLAVGGGEAKGKVKLRPWVAGLSRWGKEARVRAALAVAEILAVAPKLVVDTGFRREPPRRLGDPDTARAALVAVRAWVDCPCEAHHSKLLDVADDAGCDYPAAKDLGDPAWGTFAQVASATAYLASAPDDSTGYTIHSGDEIKVALTMATADELRAAIVAALIPWALAARGSSP